MPKGGRSTISSSTSIPPTRSCRRVASEPNRTQAFGVQRRQRPRLRAARPGQRLGQATRGDLLYRGAQEARPDHRLPSDQGKVTAVLSDVTARKQAQNELQIARDNVASSMSAEWAQKLRESEARFLTTVKTFRSTSCSTIGISG